MKNSIFNMNSDKTKNQIRRPPVYLIGAILLGGVFLLFAALSQADRWLFGGLGLFVLIYGFLTGRNDRVTYNESGITMYSILGKPFEKDWSTILDVDVVAEQLVSKRFFVGLVLHIKFLEGKGSSAKVYRFPYRDYIGIDDFLLFSASRLPEKRENKPEDSSAD